MAVSYLSNGASPTAARMNLLFADLDTKLSKMLSNGRSWLLGIKNGMTSAHEMERLMGRPYFFFNPAGPSPYSRRIPRWHEHTENYSQTPFNAAEAVVMTKYPLFVNWLSFDEVTGVVQIERIAHGYFSDAGLVEGTEVHSHSGGGDENSVVGFFDNSLVAHHVKFPVVEFVCNFGSENVPASTFTHDGTPGSFFISRVVTDFNPSNRIRLPGLNQAAVEAVSWTVHWNTEAREALGDPYYSETFTLAGKVSPQPGAPGAYKVTLNDDGTISYAEAEPDMDWWIQEDGSAADPERRNRYGLAEIIVENQSSIELPAEHFKFCCYRINNLQRTALTVNIGLQSFTVDPFKTKSLRYVPNARQSFALAHVTGFFVGPAAHGLVDGDEVILWATKVPLGLSYGTRYFVRDSATGVVRLAATLGGAALAPTSDGEGVMLEKVATWSASSMAYFQTFVAGDPMIYWWPRTRFNTNDYVFNQDYRNLRNYLGDVSASELGLAASAIGGVNHVVNSGHASNLVNPAIALEWIEVFSRECDPGAGGYTYSKDYRKNCLLFSDPHVRCDMDALGLTGEYGDITNDATLMADLFWHKGVISVARTTIASGALENIALNFRGFATMVADFAAVGIVVTRPNTLQQIVLEPAAGYSIVLTAVSTNLLGTLEAVEIDGGYAIELNPFEQNRKYFAQLTKQANGDMAARHKDVTSLQIDQFSDYVTAPTVDKGAWDGADDYELGDIVKHKGVKYLCIADVLGSVNGPNGQAWPVPHWKTVPTVENHSFSGVPIYAWNGSSFDGYVTFRATGTERPGYPASPYRIIRDSDSAVMVEGVDYSIATGSTSIPPYGPATQGAAEVRVLSSALENEDFTLEITNYGWQSTFSNAFWRGFKAEDAWDDTATYTEDHIVVSGCGIFAFTAGGDATEDPWENSGAAEIPLLTPTTPVGWTGAVCVAESRADIAVPPAGTGIYGYHIYPSEAPLRSWMLVTNRDTNEAFSGVNFKGAYTAGTVATFRLYPSDLGVPPSLLDPPEDYYVSIRQDELFYAGTRGADLIANNGLISWFPESNADYDAEVSVVYYNRRRTLSRSGWQQEGAILLNYEAYGYDLQNDGVLDVSHVVTSESRNESGNVLVMAVVGTGQPEFDPFTHTVASLKSLAHFRDADQSLIGTYSKFTDVSLKFTPQGPALLFMEHVKAEPQAIASDFANTEAVQGYVPGTTNGSGQYDSPENCYGEIRLLPQFTYGTKSSTAVVTSTMRAHSGETLHQGEYELGTGGWIKRKRAILFRDLGWGMRNDKWEHTFTTGDAPRSVFLRHYDWQFSSPVAPMPCVDQPGESDNGGENALAYARSLTACHRYGERDLDGDHPFVATIDGVIHGDDFTIATPSTGGRRKIQRRIPITESTCYGWARGWFLPRLAPLAADHYNLLAEAINAVYAVRPLGIGVILAEVDGEFYDLETWRSENNNFGFLPLKLFAVVPESGPFRDWLDAEGITIKTSGNFPASYAAAMADTLTTSRATLSGGASKWESETTNTREGICLTTENGTFDIDEITSLEWVSIDDIKTWMDTFGIPLFLEDVFLPFRLESFSASGFQDGAHTTAPGPTWPHSTAYLDAFTQGMAFIPDQTGTGEWKKFIDIADLYDPFNPSNSIPLLKNINSTGTWCQSYQTTSGSRTLSGTLFATNLDAFTSVQCALSGDRLILERMRLDEITSIGVILISPLSATKKMLGVPDWYAIREADTFAATALDYSIDAFREIIEKPATTDAFQLTAASGSSVATGYSVMQPGTGVFQIHENGARAAV